MAEDNCVRILVVEDDIYLADSIVRILQNRQFTVKLVNTGLDAEREIVSGTEYDIWLLDIILPDGNGFDLCEKIRERSSALILFLTSCDDEESITKGLDMGGDDYITKPFRVAELMSRINANLRRFHKYIRLHRRFLISGDIRADLENVQVWKKGELLKLTPVEFQLLEIFMNNPEVIVRRNVLLEKLWDGHGNFVEDNTLTVTVSRLKSKLGVYGEENRQYIETIRGYGYRWNMRCVVSEDEKC